MYTSTYTYTYLYTYKYTYRQRERERYGYRKMCIHKYLFIPVCMFICKHNIHALTLRLLDSGLPPGMPRPRSPPPAGLLYSRGAPTWRGYMITNMVVSVHWGSFKRAPLKGLGLMYRRSRADLQKNCIQYLAVSINWCSIS